MGSAIIPLRAADDPTLPLRFRILVYLQRSKAAIDFVPTRHADLAAYFGCTAITACRCLRWLCTHGYLEAKTLRGRHGGRPQAYRVVVDEGPAAA